MKVTQIDNKTIKIVTDKKETVIDVTKGNPLSKISIEELKRIPCSITEYGNFEVIIPESESPLFNNNVAIINKSNNDIQYVADIETDYNEFAELIFENDEIIYKNIESFLKYNYKYPVAPSPKKEEKTIRDVVVTPPVKQTVVATPPIVEKPAVKTIDNDIYVPGTDDEYLEIKKEDLRLQIPGAPGFKKVTDYRIYHVEPRYPNVSISKGKLKTIFVRWDDIMKLRYPKKFKYLDPIVNLNKENPMDSTISVKENPKDTNKKTYSLFEFYIHYAHIISDVFAEMIEYEQY